jgi:ketosteroid isomerase-like protein
MDTPQQPAPAESAEQQAKRIVEEFLEASMVPDPDRARTYMAPDVVIVFTGGRRFSDPAQSTAFNAARYRWVKKKMERTDVVAGGTPEEAAALGRSQVEYWRKTLAAIGIKPE